MLGIHWPRQPDDWADCWDVRFDGIDQEAVQRHVPHPMITVMYGEHHPEKMDGDCYLVAAVPVESTPHEHVVPNHLKRGDTVITVAKSYVVAFRPTPECHHPMADDNVLRRAPVQELMTEVQRLGLTPAAVAPRPTPPNYLFKKMANVKSTRVAGNEWVGGTVTLTRESLSFVPNVANSAFTQVSDVSIPLAEITGADLRRAYVTHIVAVHTLEGDFLFRCFGAKRVLMQLRAALPAGPSA